MLLKPCHAHDGICISPCRRRAFVMSVVASPARLLSALTSTLEVKGVMMRRAVFLGGPSVVFVVS
jgi:hypothetical protein